MTAGVLAWQYASAPSQQDLTEAEALATEAEGEREELAETVAQQEEQLADQAERIDNQAERIANQAERLSGLRQEDQGVTQSLDEAPSVAATTAPWVEPAVEAMGWIGDTMTSLSENTTITQMVDDCASVLADPNWERSLDALGDIPIAWALVNEIQTSYRQSIDACAAGDLEGAADWAETAATGMTELASNLSDISAVLGSPR